MTTVPLNLVLVGKANSGKSCLVIRYISDRFVEGIILLFTENLRAGYDPVFESVQLTKRHSKTVTERSLKLTATSR